MDKIKVIEKLISCYKKLPSIGYKTAERLAYSTLDLKSEEIDSFIENLEEAKNIKRCDRCGIYIEDRCPLCNDEKRDKKTILVVSSPRDVYSIEKSGVYNGLYFTLNGTLSAVHNRDSHSTKIDELFKKIEEEKIEELILVLDSTLDGEMTCSYIITHLSSCNIKISKIAHGIPLGTSLEYLDEMTINLSIKGRQVVKEK